VLRSVAGVTQAGKGIACLLSHIKEATISDIVR
jgi:hypothetical protein